MLLLLVLLLINFFEYVLVEDHLFLYYQKVDYEFPQSRFVKCLQEVLENQIHVDISQTVAKTMLNCVHIENEARYL